MSTRSKRIALIVILIIAWSYRATISSYLTTIHKFFWHEIAMPFQPCGSVNAFFKSSNCLGQEPHTSLNGVLTISNNGSLLATGTVDGRVHLWDISEVLPKLRRTFVVKDVEQNKLILHEFPFNLPEDTDIEERMYPPHEVDSIAFSHNDRILAVAMTGQPITVYNVGDEDYDQAYKTSQNIYKSLRQLEYSGDGSILVGYAQDHEIVHVFDAESLDLLGSINGLGYGLAPDNQTLFVLNRDGRLEKWDYQELLELKQTSSDQRLIQLKPQKIQIEFISDGSRAVVMHSPTAVHIVGDKQSTDQLYNYEHIMEMVDGSHTVHFSTWETDSLKQLTSWSHEIYTTMREPKVILNDDTVLLVTTQYGSVAFEIDLATSQPKSAFVSKPYGRFYLDRWSLEGKSKSETTTYFASYKTVDFLGVVLSSDREKVYGATAVIWPYQEDEFGYLQVWDVE